MTALSVANSDEVLLTLNLTNEEINRIRRLGTTGGCGELINQ